MAYFIKTKTGRLKQPAHIKGIKNSTANDTINWCGQPNAVVGDYVSITGSSISAGTVGKIIDIDYTSFRGLQISHKGLNTAAKIHLLDGKEREVWLYFLTVIDQSAVQEVKDFYINDGRANRIKVSW